MSYAIIVVPIALWVAAVLAVFLNRLVRTKDLSELPNGRYRLQACNFGKKYLLKLCDSDGKQYKALSTEIPPPNFVLNNGGIINPDRTQKLHERKK